MANRPPMPDDLIPQIEPVMQFFERIGLKEISLDGYEADDILGTLARKFADRYEVFIVSGDKDFAQLVDDKIKLYDPMKDKFYDAAAITEKYGIKPEQFIDYLALIGDSSDNIPGVKGLAPRVGKRFEPFWHAGRDISFLEAISDNKCALNRFPTGKCLAFQEEWHGEDQCSLPASRSRRLPGTQGKNLGAALGFLQEYGSKTLIREIMAMKDMRSGTETGCPCFRMISLGLQIWRLPWIFPGREEGYTAFEPRW